MARSVLSLRLPGYLQSKLIQNGYRTVDDFDESTTQELLDVLAASDLRRISAIAQSQPSMSTAWALGRDTQAMRRFSTQHGELDSLLGGRGIQLGSILEVYGQPGSGQTALCLRLCLAIQLPSAWGGLGMNAVYVDTVGSFAYCGAARVAHDLRGQLENAIASSSGVDDPRAAPNLAPSAILDGVSVFRVHGAHELVALLAQFDQICREITNAGLLVINTVSWPFLASFPNNIIRRQVMHTEFARTLSEIAAKHQIAIVLVSQSKAADHGSPQDGDVWGRVSANRLLLRVSGDGYVARLTSSSMNPTGECYVGPKAAHHQ